MISQYLRGAPQGMQGLVWRSDDRKGGMAVQMHEIRFLGVCAKENNNIYSANSETISSLRFFCALKERGSCNI